MKFDFVERTMLSQASLFDKKMEKVTGAPEIEEGLELENYKRRYEFAKDLYQGNKHEDTKNLLIAIDLALDFISLKLSGASDDELFRKHNEFIDQCNDLLQSENTRNGLFTIGLIGGDLGRIYDLKAS